MSTNDPFEANYLVRLGAFNYHFKLLLGADFFCNFAIFKTGLTFFLCLADIAMAVRLFQLG
jgi:hypothetical protein